MAVDGNQRFCTMLALVSCLVATLTKAFHVTKMQHTKASHLYAVTLGGQPGPRDVLLHDMNSMIETKLKHVKIKSKIGGAVYFNDSLVLCGGDKASFSLNCSQYNTNFAKEKISNIPTLPSYLQYFTLTIYRETLLLVGGRWFDSEDNKSVRSSAVYEMQPGKWSLRNSLKSPRSSHGCESIYPDNLVFVDISKERRQDVYCMGGIGANGQVMREMEMLSFKSDQWAEAPSMIRPRGSFASTSFRGKVYVTGGKTTAGEVENTVEVYDVIRRTWQLFDGLMNQKRYYHTAFYADGLLYVRGGVNTKDAEQAKRTIEFISVDKWSGELGEKFQDYHTTYESKYLHKSILLPKSFMPNGFATEPLAKRKVPLPMAMTVNDTDEPGNATQPKVQAHSNLQEILRGRLFSGKMAKINGKLGDLMPTASPTQTVTVTVEGRSKTAIDRGQPNALAQGNSTRIVMKNQANLSEIYEYSSTGNLTGDRPEVVVVASSGAWDLFSLDHRLAIIMILLFLRL